MKQQERLEKIKNEQFSLYFTERIKVFNELSDAQPMFCCCGRLASGLHESNCRKFNKKVDFETLKRVEEKLKVKS